MNKKAIILCMSCNQERYINEEEVIRQTWGKDILEGKYDNIELMFYRGGSDNTYLEDDILHLTSDDTLIGTYQKSIDAFNFLLENKDFDYVIRTNTSTYINICAIQQFLEFNIEEEIVCGPYLIINQCNSFIPFLSGFYLIFSKQTINLLVHNRMIKNNFDDNSFAISLFKIYNRRYLQEYILEIDAIDFKDINNSDLNKYYCVRVKDELTLTNTVNNMKITHERYISKYNKDKRVNEPHGFTKIYTIYGQIPI